MAVEAFWRVWQGCLPGRLKSSGEMGSAEQADLADTTPPPVGGLSYSCRPSSRKWVSKLEKVEDARNRI